MTTYIKELPSSCTQKKKLKNLTLEMAPFYIYVVDEILESAHSSILRFIGMVFIKLTLWAAVEYGNGILN